jgi:hypothetical protein
LRRAGRRRNLSFFSQGCLKLAKSPVPTAGSPLPAASHGQFAALRGLIALPRIELEAALSARLLASHYN